MKGRGRLEHKGQYFPDIRVPTEANLQFQDSHKARIGKKPTFNEAMVGMVEQHGAFPALMLLLPIVLSPGLLDSGHFDGHGDLFGGQPAFSSSRAQLEELQNTIGAQAVLEMGRASILPTPFNIFLDALAREAITEQRSSGGYAPKNSSMFAGGKELLLQGAKTEYWSAGEGGFFVVEQQVNNNYSLGMGNMVAPLDRERVGAQNILFDLTLESFSKSPVRNEEGQEVGYELIRAGVDRQTLEFLLANHSGRRGRSLSARLSRIFADSDKANISIQVINEGNTQRAVIFNALSASGEKVHILRKELKKGGVENNLVGGNAKNAMIIQEVLQGGDSQLVLLPTLENMDKSWKDKDGWHAVDKEGLEYALVEGDWLPVETPLDFTPAYDTGVVEVQVEGVPVNFQIMTADNLDGKGIGAVKINDSKVTRWNQERSEAALGEFTLKMLYEVWQARGGAEGRGGDKGVSFEQFAGMIAAGDVDGTKIRLTNVYQMGAEEPMRELWIAPFAPEGADTGEATAIRNVNFVFTNATRTEGMTVVDQNNGSAMKMVLSHDTLYLYFGLDRYGNSIIASTASRLTKMMSGLPKFLQGGKGFWSNTDLRKTIAFEHSNSCYSSAIQVFDGVGKMSREEQKCNP